MIDRLLLPRLEAALRRSPAVALTGPRQVGKTTLAFALQKEKPSLYLDLEDPQDRLRAEAIGALQAQNPKTLLMLDEVQRLPDVFSRLRGIIDKERRQGNKTGLFLLLGSASMELLRQSSESLAGRITYLELFPVNALEYASRGPVSTLWQRGGFPESLLADSDEDSYAWRQDFIRTYIERDMPQLGLRLPGATLERFWQMLAYNQGTPFNAAQYARNMDVSSVTVARYLDFMADLLLVRKLAPWTFNINKRLTRSPKVYVRDSGITHALTGVKDYTQLLGHPVMGGSWEGFVMENILSILQSRAQPYYYRTANGAEIDLILEFSPRERWAIEIKHNPAPRLSKGFFIGCEDTAATRRIVVHSGVGSFPMANDVEAISLPALLETLQSG